MSFTTMDPTRYSPSRPNAYQQQPQQQQQQQHIYSNNLHHHDRQSQNNLPSLYDTSTSTAESWSTGSVGRRTTNNGGGSHGNYPAHYLPKGAIASPQHQSRLQSPVYVSSSSPRTFQSSPRTTTSESGYWSASTTQRHQPYSVPPPDTPSSQSEPGGTEPDKFSAFTSRFSTEQRMMRPAGEASSDIIISPQNSRQSAEGNRRVTDVVNRFSTSSGRPTGPSSSKPQLSRQLSNGSERMRSNDNQIHQHPHRQIRREWRATGDRRSLNTTEAASHSDKTRARSSSVPPRRSPMASGHDARRQQETQIHHQQESQQQEQQQQKQQQHIDSNNEVSSAPKTVSRATSIIETPSPARVCDLKRQLWDNDETLQVTVKPNSKVDVQDRRHTAFYYQSPEMAGRRGQRESRSLSPGRRVDGESQRFRHKFYEAALAAKIRDPSSETKDPSVTSGVPPSRKSRSGPSEPANVQNASNSYSRPSPIQYRSNSFSERSAASRPYDEHPAEAPKLIISDNARTWEKLTQPEKEIISATDSSSWKENQQRQSHTKNSCDEEIPSTLSRGTPSTDRMREPSSGEHRKDVSVEPERDRTSLRENDGHVSRHSRNNNFNCKWPPPEPKPMPTQQPRSHIQQPEPSQTEVWNEQQQTNESGSKWQSPLPSYNRTTNWNEGVAPPTWSSPEQKKPSNEKVASLVAKLAAVNRENPAEALAQIDSILRQESRSSSDSSPVPRQQESQQRVAPADPELTMNDDDDDDDDDDEDDSADDETSVSSITDPTYHGGKPTADQGLEPFFQPPSTAAFRRPRPSTLASYVAPTNVSSSIEQTKTKDRKKIPHSSPPPTIKVKDTAVAAPLLISKPTVLKPQADVSKALLDESTPPRTRKLDAFMSKQSPSIAIGNTNSAAIAQKIKVWDELSTGLPKSKSGDSERDKEKQEVVSSPPRIPAQPNPRRQHPWDGKLPTRQDKLLAKDTSMDGGVGVEVDISKRNNQSSGFSGFGGNPLVAKNESEAVSKADSHQMIDLSTKPVKSSDDFFNERFHEKVNLFNDDAADWEMSTKTHQLGQVQNLQRPNSQSLSDSFDDTWVSLPANAFFPEAGRAARADFLGQHSDIRSAEGVARTGTSLSKGRMYPSSNTSTKLANGNNGREDAPEWTRQDLNRSTDGGGVEVSLLQHRRSPSLEQTVPNSAPPSVKDAASRRRGFLRSFKRKDKKKFEEMPMPTQMKRTESFSTEKGGRRARTPNRERATSLERFRSASMAQKFGRVMRLYDHDQ